MTDQSLTSRYVSARSLFSRFSATPRLSYATNRVALQPHLTVDRYTSLLPLEQRHRPTKTADRLWHRQEATSSQDCMGFQSRKVG